MDTSNVNTSTVPAPASLLLSSSSPVVPSPAKTNFQTPNSISITSSIDSSTYENAKFVSETACVEIAQSLKFVPNFSKISSLPDDISISSFEIHWVDPSTGIRGVVKVANSESLSLKNFVECLPKLSESSQRKYSDISVKSGPPAKGNWATQFPCWDFRLRYHLLVDANFHKTEIPARFGYLLKDTVVVDVVVDEELKEGFTAYPFY